MGTAPTDRQHPAMPDPDRVVTRSVGVLKHLGMTRQAALETVVLAAMAVRRRLIAEGHADSSWPEQVIAAALERVEVPGPSDTDHTGDDHGDGSSGRAGRPA